MAPRPTIGEQAHQLKLPENYSFLDILPGYWMWRQDPTIEALLHNHDMWPLVTYSFGGAVCFYSFYVFLGRINRPATRPLFVINKKTWFNTKVPRRRARDYARHFMKPPGD